MIKEHKFNSTSLILLCLSATHKYGNNCFRLLFLIDETFGKYFIYKYCLNNRWMDYNEIISSTKYIHCEIQFVFSVDDDTLPRSTKTTISRLLDNF